MNYLRGICLVASLLFGTYAVLCFIGYLVELIRPKTREYAYNYMFDFLSWRPKISITISMAIALFLIVNPIYSYINSMPDGVYCYTAIVSKDGKSYSGPAEVYRWTGDTSSEYKDYITGEPKEYVTSNTHISINKFYWPNGGYLYFDDAEIYFDNTTHIDDQDGNRWKVTLTAERNSYYKIMEKFEPKPITDLVLCSTMAFCILFSIVQYIFLLKNK